MNKFNLCTLAAAIYFSVRCSEGHEWSTSRKERIEMLLCGSASSRRGRRPSEPFAVSKTVCLFGDFDVNGYGESLRAFILVVRAN
jgi:hypothetical protein